MCVFFTGGWIFVSAPFFFFLLGQRSWQLAHCCAPKTMRLTTNFPKLAMISPNLDDLYSCLGHKSHTYYTVHISYVYMYIYIFIHMQSFLTRTCTHTHIYIYTPWKSNFFYRLVYEPPSPIARVYHHPKGNHHF